jgi:hypothetical protein
MPNSEQSEPSNSERANRVATSNDGETSAANSAVTRTPSLWEETIPWFMTAISVLVLICLAWLLLDNIYWFRNTATSPLAPISSDYRIYVYQMHLAMINRSVGIFSGFALIFIGTSVAFFTLKQYTQLEGGTTGATAKLSSASPGIVAMFLGVMLIMFTISSKDHFPLPPSGQVIDVRPQANDPQPQ